MIWSAINTIAIIYILYRLNLNKKQLDLSKKQQEKNTKILRNSTAE